MYIYIHTNKSVLSIWIYTYIDIYRYTCRHSHTKECVHAVYTSVCIHIYNEYILRVCMQYAYVNIYNICIYIYNTCQTAERACARVDETASFQAPPDRGGVPGLVVPAILFLCININIF